MLAIYEPGVIEIPIDVIPLSHLGSAGGNWATPFVDRYSGTHRQTPTWSIHLDHQIYDIMIMMIYLYSTEAGPHTPLQRSRFWIYDTHGESQQWEAKREELGCCLYMDSWWWSTSTSWYFVIYQQWETSQDNISVRSLPMNELHLKMLCMAIAWFPTASTLRTGVLRLGVIGQTTGNYPDSSCTGSRPV